jgi:hypothetical protein
LVWAVLLAGCYGPQFVEGLACSESDACPEGQRCDLPSGLCVSGAPPPGVVAAYAFEGGADLVVPDLSGRDNHAATMGILEFVPVKFGNGVRLNDGPFLLVPFSDTIDVGGDALTVAVWIQPDLPDPAPGDFPRVGVVVEKQRSALDDFTFPFVQYNLEVTNSTFAGAVSDNVALKQCFYALGDERQLHHVAITYDGATMIGYLDGEPIGGTGDTCDSTPLLIAKNPFDLMIGRSTSSDERYVGTIDNLRIYDRVLDADEIRAEMNKPVVLSP